MESIRAVPCNIAVKMPGSDIENTNDISTDYPLVTEDVSTLQALQSITDANDGEPDYDEPPDEVEGAGLILDDDGATANDSEPDYDEPPDEDGDATENESMPPGKQTVTNENSDDEPDYDLPPDADFLPLPPNIWIDWLICLIISLSRAL